MSRSNPESQEEASYWNNIEAAEKEEYEADMSAQAESEVLQHEYEEAVEEMAEKLHNWYLEATKNLHKESYNKKAQIPYKDLTEEQKQIDRYIAEQIIELLARRMAEAI